jgi:hypothetical protein
MTVVADVGARLYAAAGGDWSAFLRVRSGLLSPSSPLGRAIRCSEERKYREGVGGTGEFMERKGAVAQKSLERAVKLSVRNEGPVIQTTVILLYQYKHCVY